MPPKRAKTKSGIARTDGEDEHTMDQLIDTIFLNTRLKLKQIVERGCASTMNDIQAEFYDASNWLHTQKDTLKDVIRKSSKNVPRTPRRGMTFLQFRETAESYGGYVLFDDGDDEMVDHAAEGDNPFADGARAAASHEYTETVVALEIRNTDGQAAGVQDSNGEEIDAEPETSYEDAVCSNGTEQCGDSRANERSDPVAVSPQESEPYLSALEGTSNSQRSQQVKNEYVSPYQPGPLPSRTIVVETPATSVNVKQEVLSSRLASTRRNHVDATPVATTDRVMRSTTRAKTVISSVSASRTPSNASSTAQNREQRAAAGRSQTRLAKPVHEHVVTTPCKREYRTAVQRVMDDQAVARTLSPRRAPTRTPAQAAKAARPTTVAAAANSKQTLARKKAEEMRRNKEDLAAQLREEQCKERAERIRKEREEKAMRAQRRREQKEAEEREKAELRRQKEERDEQRRGEIRLQKSPARSRCPSRYASPARVPKANAGKDSAGRTAAKTLFPATPGRAPSKMARLLDSGGESSREPTMNTPTREVRRKVCPSKKERLISSDDTDDDFVSPRAMTKRHEAAREERERIMKKEHERHERLREEEKRRMRRDENERQRLMSSGFPSVKMEVDEVPNIVEEQPLVFNEGEQQRIDEEAERERLKIEQELREMQQRMLLEEEQRRREQERREMERRQMERELEEQRKLEALKEEERLRMLEEQAKRVREEEKRLVEAAEQERRERLRAEEEEALKRLNISSQAELQNRHLLNVSMNTPAPIVSSSANRGSSYEITPDKVFKPSSENNYNIEDLSSGDETDSEDAPRKKVPAWAEGSMLRRALEKQAHKLRAGEFDQNVFFGEISAPELTQIFGTTKKYPRRGSSGIWDSPISKPRQGVGAFQKRFNRNS